MFVLHVEEVENSRIEMQIWDTAGQEKFRSLGPIYYRNSAAGIIVFDLTSNQSFDHLNSWYESFIGIAGTDVITALVGNKSDLTDSRVVSNELAKNWAEQKGCLYYETSALTGDGLSDLFQGIALQLANKKQEQETVMEITPIQKQNNTKSDCKC